MALLMIDLDDTLIDRHGAFSRAVSNFLCAQQLPATDVDWIMTLDAAGYTARREVADAMLARYADLRENDVFNLLRCGACDYVTITSDTAAALGEAREAGFRIVIVTNGPAAQQAAKIRKAGLDGLVDGRAISEEIGARKPDSAMFAAAAALVRGELDGAWVVGDRDDTDILGAHRLGARSVWLHLGRKWTRPDYRPTSTAGSPGEAIRYILDRAHSD